MKLLRNLSIGLALATVLAATAEMPDLPTRTVNGKEYYYYEVPKKETIYSITRKFGFTRDVIIRYNPQVRDGLRAGDTLLFPVEEIEEISAPVADSVEPAVNNSERSEPSVPVEPSESSESSKLTEDADVIEPSDSLEMSAPSEFADSLESTEEVDTLNIAVMLPFMLEAENVTRQAENNTNFYRGMLLAVDEFVPQSGFKVNMLAYDTEGSADVVARQLAQPEMTDMDYIIAPNDSLSIERIAAVADSTSAMVMNFFAVKNESEKLHESLLQGNIPRAEMYSRAIDAFCKEYASKKVIILNPTDLHADKKEFVEELTARMVERGIPYEQIDFSGRLASETLAELPLQEYVFVPTGASREIMLRILAPLTEYNAAVAGGNAVIFGYPEWVTMRGEIKDKLHKLNAVIYSRFSTDLAGERAKRVQDAYKKWYGVELPQAVPNTVLLGYDVMAWLLYASANGITEPFEGVQNAFRVNEIDGAGDVNTALYFISFRADGDIDAIVL